MSLASSRVMIEIRSCVYKSGLSESLIFFTEREEALFIPLERISKIDDTRILCVCRSKARLDNRRLFVGIGRKIRNSRIGISRVVGPLVQDGGSMMAA